MSHVGKLLYQNDICKYSVFCHYIIFLYGFLFPSHEVVIFMACLSFVTVCTVVSFMMGTWYEFVAVRFSQCCGRLQGFLVSMFVRFFLLPYMNSNASKNV